MWMDSSLVAPVPNLAPSLQAGTQTRAVSKGTKLIVVDPY